MDEKLNHSDLSALLAKQGNMSVAKSEQFSKAFFDLIIEGLEQEGAVKINSLGTFKIIDVASRSSVNVNTGEKFEIKGHKKLTFIPADSLKEKVNQPFAIFEPVEIVDEYVDDVEDGTDEEPITDNPCINDAEIPKSEPTEQETVDKEPDASSAKIEDDSKEELPLESTENNQEEQKGIENESVANEGIEIKSGTIKQSRGKVLPTIISVVVILLLSIGMYISSSPSIATENISEEKKTTIVCEESVQRNDVSDTVFVTKPEKEKPYSFTLVKELAETPLSAISLKDTLIYKADGHIAVHKVGVDETLTKISLIYYENKRLWPYIVMYNKMTDHNQLAIGMKLLIPKLQPLEKIQR